MHGNGTCVACVANWSLEADCNDCDSRHFGANCSEPCTCKHGVNISGVHGNGSCSVCQPNWTGANCDDCDRDHFGLDCAQACTCEHGVANSSGIYGNGSCTSCTVASWYFGPDCAACTCQRGTNSSGSVGNGHCVGDCKSKCYSGSDCNQCNLHTDPLECESRYNGLCHDPVIGVQVRSTCKVLCATCTAALPEKHKSSVTTAGVKAAVGLGVVLLIAVPAAVVLVRWRARVLGAKVVSTVELNEHDSGSHAVYEDDIDDGDGDDPLTTH